MRYCLIIILNFLFLNISAQNSASISAQKIIDQISFSEDSVQSVFSWVSNYLVYDTQFPINKKKYSEPQELIRYALSERSGICQHYAELFHFIMSELNYPSYVISGYSNNTPGNSHAWNAVKIKGQWYLFDPTFASGGITSSGRFIKEYDAVWYKVHPDDFIRTHMPFDYVWQFKSSPITYKSFDENNFSETIKSDLNYESFTNTFTKLDDKAWCSSAIARVNEQAYRNPLVSNYLSYLNSISYGLEINEKVDAHNIEIERMNLAVELFNSSVTAFNDYMYAKNRRFKVSGFSTQFLQPKMNKILDDVSEAMAIFSTVETHNEQTMKVVRENLDLGHSFLQNIKTEQAFIRKYLNRSERS